MRNHVLGAEVKKVTQPFHILRMVTDRDIVLFQAVKILCEFSMKKGCLSEYFSGVVAKRLSAVEADPKKSNQHEFNGVKPLRSLLGDDRMDQMPSRFMYFGDDEEKTIRADGYLTWYDSRIDQPHRSAEYRLYFPTTSVTEMMQEGDLLFVAKKTDGSIQLITVQGGSTVENQLLWLFGIIRGTED